MTEGWICPKCGSIWSPDTTGCINCNNIMINQQYIIYPFFYTTYGFRLKKGYYHYNPYYYPVIHYYPKPNTDGSCGCDWNEDNKITGGKVK